MFALPFHTPGREMQHNWWRIMTLKILFGSSDSKCSSSASQFVRFISDNLGHWRFCLVPRFKIFSSIHPYQDGGEMLVTIAIWSNYSDLTPKLGGGFKYFLFSSLLWGNDPIWRACFSNGLVQPPTRKGSFFLVSGAHSPRLFLCRQKIHEVGVRFMKGQIFFGQIFYGFARCFNALLNRTIVLILHLCWNWAHGLELPSWRCQLGSVGVRKGEVVVVEFQRDQFFKWDPFFWGDDDSWCPSKNDAYNGDMPQKWCIYGDFTGIFLCLERCIVVLGVWEWFLAFLRDYGLPPWSPKIIPEGWGHFLAGVGGFHSVRFLLKLVPFSGSRTLFMKVIELCHLQVLRFHPL